MATKKDDKENVRLLHISLGQISKFDFRKKDHHHSNYSLPIPHGILLIMKGDSQENWEHRITKSNIPVKEQNDLYSD